MLQIVLKRLSPALFVGWSGTLTALTVATAKPRRGLRLTTKGFKTMETWTPSNTEETGKYLGIVEFQSVDGEWHNFRIFETETRLVFGGFCNIGFLESGYTELDPCFSTDANLQELISDLETYYNDGPEYTNGLVCTERM